jgi:TPR repeat protein
MGRGGGHDVMRTSAAVFVLFAAIVCGCPNGARAVNLTPPHGKHVPPFRAEPTAPRNIEPVTDCDRTAASPEDSQRVSDGIPLDNLDGTLAVTQCQNAVAAHPSVARFLYQLGRGQERLGNDTAALQSYRNAADLGSLIASFSAGVRERDGVGTDRDDEEATRLFKLCADKGDADCLNSLAYQYQEGRGVPADPTEAARLYRQAAADGLIAANVNLGFLYRDGDGMPADYAEAARQFQVAADRGDATGARNLALLYQNGQGVPKDEAKAVTLFQLAADHGDDDALIKLAVAYLDGAGVPKDETKSVAYYQQAADRGSSDGMAGLAFAYANGHGVTVDAKAAAQWIVRALATGNDYSFDQLTNHWGSWSLETRMAVQSILADRGLYGGNPNGDLNRETLKAIKVLAGREE